MIRGFSSVYSLVSTLGLVVMLTLGSSQALAQDAAQDPEGAQTFITKLADDVMVILNNTQMTQEERDDAFRGVLRKGFALNQISRLVLGRHWRTASEAQRKEYLKVFPEYVLKIYVRRLTEFGDEEFAVDGTEPAGKKDIIVRSQIIRPNAPSIAADWRVRKRDGQFRIIDLKIEGISMAITQREEFSARIAEIGMDGLLAELREGAEMDPPPSKASLVP